MGSIGTSVDRSGPNTFILLVLSPGWDLSVFGGLLA